MTIVEAARQLFAIYGKKPHHFGVSIDQSRMCLRLHSVQLRGRAFDVPDSFGGYVVVNCFDGTPTLQIPRELSEGVGE